MRKRTVVIHSSALLMALCLLGFSTGSAEKGPAPQRFMILGSSTALPPGLEKRVVALGGTVTGVVPEIGMMMVSSANPDFAKSIAKEPQVRSVFPDLEFQWTPLMVADGSDQAKELSIGSDESYFPFQWAPVTVHAPEAWDLGARGTGVRVAIVDGGISSNHLDLDGNLDVAASKSFVPGQQFNFDTGTFWHATHVAGIVAAEDNGIGTIGVAPGATLIGVKVLHNGSGPFGRINQGIVYAAKEAGADVINVSLGASFPRSGFWSDPGTPTDPSDDVWIAPNVISELIVSLQRALSYAYQLGATIVVSAGNDAANADGNGNYFIIPAQLPHTITVSATGPVNFAAGGRNFDRPASYTNYGTSLIDLAAPGGDYTLFPNGPWYYDMVMSPSYVFGQSHYYSWAAGTSMSAPHVAGVAALVIEANGGLMHPAQVEKILRSSADDLGKPGRDDFYGHGRVNALNAVLAARAGTGSDGAMDEVALEPRETMPTEITLSGAYPNPFNPSTNIGYQLPEPTNVSLEIFNSLGQHIRTLVSGVIPPGEHVARWDGRDETGTIVSSGVYLCRLHAGRVLETRTLMLLK